MENIAVIFAGGTGTRMQNYEVPKQFLKVNNKEIIIHTLEVFEKNENIDAIICVCLESWIEYLKKIISENRFKKIISIIPGGRNPLESQYFGLCEIKNIFPEEILDNIIVLMHDGVRPLIDDKTINNNIIIARDNGSAITYTKAIETVVEIDSNENRIIKIFNRDNCVMAKAPQTFKFVDLFNTHKKAIKDKKLDFIDSATMMFHYGFNLHLVLGDPINIKVTTPIDYKMLLAIYE
ncbi:2-C-methyl-D-erythritol 4-phosphate cytidylyltransferase [Gallibacterium genomosp. 3]|uniref:2-C-methyl-D-erythritol 4-phosphate cytidylyltransferase n=1 Tax=Gallibacterium genomosp. 3 TaxID=505345 RepID=A0A1A7Q6W6_9PAST|nr:2-C-methyl-D-erythritol 4-phosphate cytidylyltransferase [Gallibacterium genomosp. 3]